MFTLNLHLIITNCYRKNSETSFPFESSYNWWRVIILVYTPGQTYTTQCTYLPLRVWKMFLPAMSVMWPMRERWWVTWPQSGQSWPSVRVSYGPVLSNIYVNTAPTTARHTGTINYTNNYCSVKLGLFVIISRVPTWFIITLLWRKLRSLSLWSWDQSASLWAIWSLSEDWCEVLGKFKIISLPGAAVIMKY